MTELTIGHGDSDLVGAVATLHGAERQAVSAFTVIRGSMRQVVYNDAQDPGRTANNITHELCHGLLLHPPAPALDHRGCRIWNADHEDEATFQSGALLIPAKAAWWIAKQRQPLLDASLEYGCSQDLVRWRINITGARRLLTG
jgi:Zn-dependent peptidase ImmA (M78 family)